MKTRNFVNFLFLLLFISCGKKVEKQFPLGYYQFHLQEGYYYHDSYKYEPDDSYLTVKLLTVESTQFTVQHYRYISGFDTSFAPISTLLIEDKSMVSGILNTSWGTAYTISNGVIYEKAKSEYIIEGDRYNEFFIDFGPSSDWVDIYGKFTFERMP